MTAPGVASLHLPVTLTPSSTVAWSWWMVDGVDQGRQEFLLVQTAKQLRKTKAETSESWVHVHGVLLLGVGASAGSVY